MKIFPCRIFWAMALVLLSLLGNASALSAAPQNTSRTLANPAAPHLGGTIRLERDGLVVEVPGSVDESGIVPVRVLAAPANTGEVTLLWRGKTFSLPLENRRGMTLLPAPARQEKENRCLLKVRMKQVTLVFPVRIQRVRWPVQHISVAKNYVTPSPKTLERIAADRARTKATLAHTGKRKLWTPPFTRPVPGRITSVFGGKRLFNGELRSRHYGVDLRGANGTPIRAVADGRVLMAENQYFSGNMVYVDHGQGLLSFYCHMSRINVRVGDRVKAGQTLGLVGSTGRVSGPHLHFGVRLHGEMVNPMSLFSIR